MRAGFFIDGFNMYGAIEQHVQSQKLAGIKPPHFLKWLSYRSLCGWIASTPHQAIAINGSLALVERCSVAFINLYTALPEDPIGKPSGTESKRDRHQTFLEASRAESVNVVLGSFKYRTEECRKCGASYRKAEEKETDVRIAIDIAEAAHRDEIDIAFVLTSDSDIAPAVQRVREHSPLKIVTVAFEPRSHSKEILSFAHYRRLVRISHLEKSLLGEKVSATTGQIHRPSKYRPF